MSEELVKQFDVETDDLPTIPSVGETFKIPTRNWNSLIDTYNQNNKKKFFLTALDCKSIIEHVKRGVPPQFIFKSKGISRVRYSNYISFAAELQDRFETLFDKETLTDIEREEFVTLLYHPLRVLILDVLMAEGISDLLDWETFNKKAEGNPELLLTKMKAKFKDIFGEKGQETGANNVTINIGGNWLEKMIE